MTICENWIQSGRHVEDTLAHELVHAIDASRVRRFDSTDCVHVACSEVRAANLSGECRFTREVLRGNVYQFAAAHQVRCAAGRAAAHRL